MTIGGGLVLGIVQGLTEFLPISSSGHLIIARELFGFGENGGLAFDAVLQLGTLLALLVYFARDILALPKHLVMLKAIAIGTVPAMIVGLLLEHTMETVFRSAFIVALMLILGSVIMYLAEHFAKHNATLTMKKGFWIGVFQCLALVPGISRSGATISGGLILGLTREEAARFSFLLSIPIIGGTGLKKFYDLVKHGELTSVGPELALGFLAAFVVGYICIAFLLKYLKTHTLKAFIWYRVALACLVFGFLAVR